MEKEIFYTRCRNKVFPHVLTEFLLNWRGLKAANRYDTSNLSQHLNMCYIALIHFNKDFVSRNALDQRFRWYCPNRLKLQRFLGCNWQTDSSFTLDGRVVQVVTTVISSHSRLRLGVQTPLLLVHTTPILIDQDCQFSQQRSWFSLFTPAI